MDEREKKIWNDGFNRGIRILGINIKREAELMRPDLETNMIDLDNLSKLIDKIIDEIKEGA